MNWKQIFCKHIWEDLKEKKLREYNDFIFGQGTYSVMEIAVNQQCIKCDKTRVIKEVYKNRL